MEPISDAILQAKIAALVARANTFPSAPRLLRCEACEDTGFVDVGNGRVGRCPQCRRLPASAEGVPLEFHTSTFETYRSDAGNQAALHRAQAFLGGKKDLLLVGGVGVGKTRLACAVLNEFFRQQRTGLFVRVPAMLHALQPRSEGDDRALEQKLVTVPLLVLDDLGAERDQATDYTRRTLLMLYEQRSDQGLRTVWTSNKSLDELAQMQDDDRLASRLAGRCDVVQLRGADRRLSRSALEVA